MNKEELKAKLLEIDQECEKKREEANIEYAHSNNPYKKGDIIEDHIGKLQIKTIEVFGLSFIPQCSFTGIELKKDGTPAKKQTGRIVYQDRIKEMKANNSYKKDDIIEEHSRRLLIEIIRLENHRTPGSRVFTGRARGIEVRNNSKIDEIESTNDKVIIEIPEDIGSISPSFLEEFLVNVVTKLKPELFYKKFEFKSMGRYNIQAALGEAVVRISRTINT